MEVFEKIDTFFALHPKLETWAYLFFVLVGAVLALLLVRSVALRIFRAVRPHLPRLGDETVVDERSLRLAVWLVPAMAVHQGVLIVPGLTLGASRLIQKLALVAILVIGARLVNSILLRINDIYSRFPVARTRPIKGYMQIGGLLAYLVVGVLVVSLLLDKSPIYFLSGLGALTAVILLIFRDTLLSFVAGIQLTTNDLIRVGDWIEMPQFGADGDVVDIALYAVKVQNFDRTITVIPTHKFLEHAFKNWRGMRESGGRRITRAVHIDMSTIRFLEPAEIDRFEQFFLLRDYIRRKREELEAYNREKVGSSGLIANSRRLTNIGTLRAYITNYLRQHPRILPHMTFMVRQLNPSPEGLPLEVYVFTDETEFTAYEAVQSNIFDHILAIVPEFGLRVYQKPSGGDVLALGPQIARTLSPAPPE